MLQRDAIVTKKVGHVGSLHQTEFSSTLVAAHNEKTQIVTTELELIKASGWREFPPVELAESNVNIVGLIEVIETFQQRTPVP
jgi:hypothetical protein